LGSIPNRVGFLFAARATEGVPEGLQLDFLDFLANAASLLSDASVLTSAASAGRSTASYESAEGGLAASYGSFFFGLLEVRQLMQAHRLTFLAGANATPSSATTGEWYVLAVRHHYFQPLQNSKRSR
jgi:hypothetical protein